MAWPKAAWGGRVYFTFQFTVHHEGKSWQEPKARTWRQELKQNPPRNTTYWLALTTCPGCFPIEPRTACKGTALPTRCWPLSQQSTVKRRLHRHVPSHEPIWQTKSPSESLSFPVTVVSLKWIKPDQHSILCIERWKKKPKTGQKLG